MESSEVCPLKLMGAIGCTTRHRWPGTTSPAEAVTQLRECGDHLFKKMRFLEAAEMYRQARDLMRLSEKDFPPEVNTMVLLKLASCEVRVGGNLGDVIVLCDEVLALDPFCGKALFRRATARHSLAMRISENEKRRGALLSAKGDLVVAAEMEPQNQQTLALLEEVSQDIHSIETGNTDQNTPQRRRRLVCSVCGHKGHSSCGIIRWHTERAHWLGMLPTERLYFDSSEILSLEQGSFQMGIRPLMRQRSFADMSDDEQETLEDCLCSTERPFVQLRCNLPLAVVIDCAERIWAEDG